MSRSTFWGKKVIRNFKFFPSFLDFARRLLNFGKVFPAGLCLNCILRVYNKIFRERSFLEIYFFFHHFRSLRKIFCWSFFGGAVKSAPTCPLGKLIEKVILFEKDFLPCLDTVPKLVAFLLKFFQRRRQNCKTRVHKNVFSTKVFLENSIFFSLFCDFDVFFRAFWQFIFKWVVKTEWYVTVEDFWEKKIEKEEIFHLFGRWTGNSDLLTNSFQRGCQTFLIRVHRIALKERFFEQNICILRYSYRKRTLLAFLWIFFGGVVKTAFLVLRRTFWGKKSEI